MIDRAPTIIGIDPGPVSCGVVVYHLRERAVVEAHSAATVDQVLELVAAARRGPPRGALLDQPTVAIERMQSYGIAGGSLLETAEVGGRIAQRALDSDLPVVRVYRREVLRALDVTGRGNRDALARQRLIEAHGGTREEAVGRKAAPGPLYGVSGHAWAALAVAMAALEGAGTPIGGAA